MTSRVGAATLKGATGQRKKAGPRKNAGKRKNEEARRPVRQRARTDPRDDAPSGPLWEAAQDLGFRRRGPAGLGATDALAPFRLGTVSLHTERDWVLLTEGVSTADPLGGSPADPGLWRRVAGSPPGETIRTFEITPTMFGPGRVDSSSWRSVLEWAVATAEGEAAPAWDSPDPSDVASWIERDALTVRVGGELRQGRVIHDSSRLSIEFPWVTSVRPDLPDARRAWLERVLLDAQKTWRLVRVSRAEDGAVVGSVDLTGAPTDLLPTMSRAALDTLRWVTSWVVPPTAFVTDLSVESRVLDAVSPTARVAPADVL